MRRGPALALALLAAGLALADPRLPATPPRAPLPGGAREPVPDGVVTRLPTRERVVALTFDACEAGQRMTLDRRITDVLLARGIPFTIFMGGRFARDNAAAVRELATHPTVSIQNHTWSHPRDLRQLGDAAVRVEVERATTEIVEVAGRRPTLFRFPGGHADARTVGLVRTLGYTTVHWRWAEGDPAPQVGADVLAAQTLARTRPGDILIFHVNGRGWHTAEALPAIIDGLTARGFRFVLVSDYVGAS
jgi:peptidoglycan/xylan/chitin deacetylase (PgdA/CDA1 family)